VPRGWITAAVAAWHQAAAAWRSMSELLSALAAPTATLVSLPRVRPARLSLKREVGFAVGRVTPNGFTQPPDTTPRAVPGQLPVVQCNGCRELRGGDQFSFVRGRKKLDVRSVGRGFCRASTHLRAPQMATGGPQRSRRAAGGRLWPGAQNRNVVEVDPCLRARLSGASGGLGPGLQRDARQVAVGVGDPCPGVLGSFPIHGPTPGSVLLAHSRRHWPRCGTCGRPAREGSRAHLAPPPRYPQRAGCAALPGHRTVGRLGFSGFPLWIRG